MTEQCGRVLERLGEPMTPELSTHLRECERCRAVVSAFEAMPQLTRQAPVHHSSVVARALSDVASHPRARPWWRDGLLAVGVNAVIFVAALLTLTRRQVVGNLAPAPIVWTIAVVLSLLAVAGPIISLAPRRRPLRSGVLAFLPLLALAVGLSGSGVEPHAGLIKAGLPCLIAETIASLVPAVFALWAITGSAFQAQRAVIAGMSAGAVGLLVLHLHCGNGSAAHLLLFHVLPWVALVAVVVGIRSRLPSRSFAP